MPDSTPSGSGDRREQALVGRTIAGKFLIESFLGGGAMGAVYRAKQLALDKDIAIKVMHVEHAQDATYAARFQREAKAASKLDHPNSMRVIDFGQEPDGLLYIAMEFLDGRDLFHVVTNDWPLSPARIGDILSQALAAIAVAHEMGIVHRDLKPENIMVLRGTDDEGKPRDLVKVCDFGIAKFTGSAEAEARASGGKKLTTQGLVVGTPEYMSPEQGKGEPLDARSDVYALGVILYQLLTGRVPFDADTALGVVLKHVTDEPKRPREVAPFADERLEAICLKAMRKKKEERYQSAREMRADLRSALGAIDPAAHAKTQEIAPLTAEHIATAPTALALDSAKVVAGAQPTSSKVTPAGTAAVVSERPRGRGAIVGVAVVAAAVIGVGVWAMRAKQSPPPVDLSAAQLSPSLTIAAMPASPSSTNVPPLANTTPLPPTVSTQKTAIMPTTKTTAATTATTSAAATAEPTPTASAAPTAPATAAPTPTASAAPTATTTASAAPTAAPFDPSHATVAWSVAGAGGGASTSAVSRSLARVSGAWTNCYRNGLQNRHQPLSGSATMHLVTDESGNVTGARVNGFDEMPGVKQCIASASHVHIDGVDTGDAWADVKLTFKPE